MGIFKFDIGIVANTNIYDDIGDHLFYTHRRRRILKTERIEKWQWSRQRRRQTNKGYFKWQNKWTKEQY